MDMRSKRTEKKPAGIWGVCGILIEAGTLGVGVITQARIQSEKGKRLRKTLYEKAKFSSWIDVKEKQRKLEGLFKEVGEKQRKQGSQRKQRVLSSQFGAAQIFNKTSTGKCLFDLGMWILVVTFWKDISVE